MQHLVKYYGNAGKLVCYFCLIISCVVLVVTTRGSWSGTLGGALSHINDEVRLDLPL